ncbi:MAG: ABC transporter substrate-binding protein [Halobacteriota archaeon]
MKKRKEIALLVCIIVVLIGGVLMAGCISPPEEGSKELPQKIVIGIGEDIKGLEPVFGTPWGAPLRPIYETLVMEDADLKIQPLLAESWEVAEDGKVWTFHLRKGIKFHDGSPFNASTVKFSFEYKPEAYRALYAMLNSIDTPDDYTVKFVLNKSYAPLLRDVSSAPIMSPTAVDENGEFKSPVGTGPFKFDEWVKGQKIVLVKNENYWRGSPKLEAVTFKIIPDASARAMALETEEIDLTGHRAGRGVLYVSDIPRLREEPEIKIVEGYTQPCVSWIQLNTEKEPFSDLKVRKAVYYGIDTQKMVTSVIGETAAPLLKGPLSMPCTEHLLNQNLTWYPYNQEKAKELLAEAGWKDTDGDGIRDRNGEQLKVTFVLSAFSPELPKIAEIVQAQLKEIGMDVKLQIVEYGAQQMMFEKGQYDMMMQMGVCGHGDTSLWLNYFFHSKRGVRCAFKDEQLTTLIDRLYTTVNSKDRLNVFYEIQEIMEEDAPGVFLYTDANVVAVNKRVKNYEMQGGIHGAYLSLWKVYIEE